MTEAGTGKRASPATPACCAAASSALLTAPAGRPRYPLAARLSSKNVSLQLKGWRTTTGLRLLEPLQLHFTPTPALVRCCPLLPRPCLACWHHSSRNDSNLKGLLMRRFLRRRVSALQAILHAGSFLLTVDIISSPHRAEHSSQKRWYLSRHGLGRVSPLLASAVASKGGAIHATLTPLVSRKLRKRLLQGLLMIIVCVYPTHFKHEKSC